MHLKLQVLIFLVSCFTGICQNPSIKGKVKDVDGKPVAYANVVLKSSESAFMTGTTTDEQGFYSFLHIPPADYILEISFLGYKTETISLKISQNTDVDAVVLTENIDELSGVTVIAKRPTVKRLVDRLVFNVENSTLSNDNIFNVLKQTPGVIVNDNKITVKNSTPIIYINDRRVHLSSSEVTQLLEGTNANQVKSIEVITNPPAKYDAEGGAVINIVTSKNIVIGYHGSVFGNFQQGFEYPKYSTGTSHFFKTKKLNTYLNYSFSPRKDFRNQLERVIFFDSNGNPQKNWITDEDRVQKSSNHNFNGNIDYQIDERNSLSFSSNVLIVPREYSKTKVNSLTKVYLNGVLDSTFNSINMAVLETFNLAFSLDYVHNFKKDGEKLMLNIHHTDFDDSNFQDVNTDYFLPNGSLIRNNKFQSFSNQIIRLNTAQIDYSLPNKSGFFEAGAKVSHINSDNLITQYIFENNQKEEDPLNSETFLYDETNYAAYTSYTKNWENLQVKLGLRAEYTNLKGMSLAAEETNENDYLKFFPSFYILKKIEADDEIYFKYNRRIIRPRYGQLNPFKFFYNDNVYTQGDPNLRPQIDDVVTLGYSINNKYTFEAYYRYENDTALEIVFQDNEENKLIYQNVNIKNNVTYGLDFLTYTNINSFWNLYFIAAGYYYNDRFYALETNNELQNNEQVSFYGRAVNYFSLLKDKSFNLDFSILYQSSYAEGPATISDRLGIDIDLRKTFWNNKASLSFGIRDILNTLNYSKNTRYLNQDIFRSSIEENRLIVVGFNYKFGNFRMHNSEREIDIEERKRL